jgi:hypothetical protein
VAHVPYRTLKKCLYIPAQVVGENKPFNPNKKVINESMSKNPKKEGLLGLYAIFSVM